MNRTARSLDGPTPLSVTTLIAFGGRVDLQAPVFGGGTPKETTGNDELKVAP